MQKNNAQHLILGVLSVLNAVRFAMRQRIDQGLGLGLGFDPVGIATIEH